MSHSEIRILWIPLSFLIAVSSAFGSEKIPNISSDMGRPEYWIQRLPEPDKVLLNPSQIETLNQKFLHAEPTAVDPLTLPEWVNPSFLLASFEKEEAAFLGKVLYDHQGRRLDKTFWSALKKSCAFKNIPDLIPVRFGLVIEECSLRTFPTGELVVEERGKFAFDLLQETTLHPGEPVALLWESRDGKWVYLLSALLRGWTPKKSVATFESKKEFVAYQKQAKMIVTERRAPFYQSAGGDSIGEWVMGTILHSSAIREEGDFFEIDRPLRDDSGKIHFVPVTVRKEMVQREFLPLTERQILMQAFKLYGAPYGWGGLKGGWDCSSFLRDVFLTMGVTLPRNSGPQSRVGKILAIFPKKGKEEEKKEILNQAVPSATLVKLDNHIMLYLGKVSDHYYVIHATAGYRKPGGFAKRVMRRDKVITTFRVLVSDMDLGKGSQKGSLFDRTISINSPSGD